MCDLKLSETILIVLRCLCVIKFNLQIHLLVTLRLKGANRESVCEFGSDLLCVPKRVRGFGTRRKKKEASPIYLIITVINDNQFLLFCVQLRSFMTFLALSQRKVAKMKLQISLRLFYVQ